MRFTSSYTLNSFIVLPQLLKIQFLLVDMANFCPGHILPAMLAVPAMLSLSALLALQVGNIKLAWRLTIISHNYLLSPALKLQAGFTILSIFTVFETALSISSRLRYAKGASSKVPAEMLMLWIPFICALYAVNVNFLRTSSRLGMRPAPCGAEQFQSKLPSPVPKITPSRALIGPSYWQGRKSACYA